jgi:RND family efflux transporter MFP subunit
LEKAPSRTRDESMKMLPWLVAGLSLAALIVGRPAIPSAPSTPPVKKEDPVVRPARKAAPSAARTEEPAAADYPFLDVKGRTQCVPGRKAIIAPVPLHPVVEVLVVPGQRVTKNQPLVKIDDNAAQADVRARKANLEGARITLKEYRRILPRIKELWLSGAGTEVLYYRTKADTLKAEQDERAATAALASAKAELEHYVVNAQVNGVVSWLDVNVGMVSKPGSAVWGEILDLSEIDVRCELTPDQADRVEVGQAAEVRRMGTKDLYAVAKVVFVGISADRGSGLVPATVRLPNPEPALRCEVPVRVRFTEARPEPIRRTGP